MALPINSTKQIAVASDGRRRSRFALNPEEGITTGAAPAAPAYTLSANASSVIATITDTGGATSYEIRYREQGGVFSGWISGLTVSGLATGPTYDVEVRGVNEYGPGPAGDPLSATTVADYTPPPPIDPADALFYDDFSSGDSSKTAGGFIWSTRGRVQKTDHPVEALPAPHSDKMGLRGEFYATNYGNPYPPTFEFYMGQLYTGDVWKRFSLYIPENFYHRQSYGLVLDITPDSPDWQEGDFVEVGSRNGYIDFVDTANNRIFLDRISHHLGGYTGSLMTNARSGATATATSVSPAVNSWNHKLNIDWEGSYSSDALDIEMDSYSLEQDNQPVPGAAYLGVVNTSSADPEGSTGGGHLRSSDGTRPLFPDPRTDCGKLFEITVHMRRSSALGANDGAVQVWARNITDDLPRKLILNNHTSIKSFHPTRNGLEQGYLLGPANGGFKETTVFYITDFYFFGNSAPSDIPAEEIK